MVTNETVAELQSTAAFQSAQLVASMGISKHVGPPGSRAGSFMSGASDGGSLSQPQ